MNNGNNSAANSNPIWVSVPISMPQTITVVGFGGGGGGSISQPLTATPKKINKDGCVCKKCKEFYPYADPPEPEKFNCYACRVRW